MTAREEEEEEAITGIESNGAHLYFCRFPSFLFPHSLPGFSLFFRLLSVLFFFFFFIPNYSPIFPYCLRLYSSHLSATSSISGHSLFNRRREKKNII